MHNPDATGRIVEWALELSSFGLKFESTSTIQSRVLAEFVAEWTATPDEEAIAATEPAAIGAETTRPVGVQPRKKMMQHPVYFVSSLLQGARSRYSGVQKLLFGLLMASRKLRHYFQAHEITVVTRLPLQRILHNPDATGRIVEWALELSSFGLKFESTSTI